MRYAFGSVTWAVWICVAGALASVGLAFLGAERAEALMSHPASLVLVALLSALFLFVGARAVKRRRFDSALLHLGCAFIMIGWLAGRYAKFTATPDRPASGAMAMFDGEQSDRLWSGTQLETYAGRVPFSVKLERFFVERYERNSDDRAAGRDAPVREYRSRVTITEPGKAPYVKNVRVNHPAYVCDYYIYQMSWGYGNNHTQMYTVLQFIRDPGLPLVYAGFAVLVAGALLFLIRVFKAGAAPAEGGAA